MVRDQRASQDRTHCAGRKPNRIECAKTAANAAEAALHSDRPYLLIAGIAYESFKYGYLPAPPPITKATVTFINAGKSPAEVIEVIATSAKFDFFPDAVEPTWDALILDQPREINPPIVGVAQSTNAIPIQVHWTPDAVNRVESGGQRVGIYGVVRYRGAPKREYYTRFFSWSSRRTNFELQKPLSPELNERT